jgi:hypothetical protein
MSAANDTSAVVGREGRKEGTKEGRRKEGGKGGSDLFCLCVGVRAK